MKLKDLTESALTLDVSEIRDAELIEDIQRQLDRIGYRLDVDGIMGRQTEAAFAKFKKNHYLADPDTIGAGSAKVLLETPTVQSKYFLPTDGIGWVSSEFGQRSLGFHKGIDIAANEGTPVYAVADGTIVTVVRGCQVGNFRCGGGYGNCIYLNHQGLPFDQTRYAHLSRPSAGMDVGNRVKKGAVIGYVGNTGHSYGPHLHFETRVDGGAKNPRHFINPIV